MPREVRPVGRVLAVPILGGPTIICLSFRYGQHKSLYQPKAIVERSQQQRASVERDGSPIELVARLHGIRVSTKILYCTNTFPDWQPRCAHLIEIAGLRLACERAKSLRGPAMLGACFVGRGDLEQQRLIKRPPEEFHCDRS